MNDKNSLNYFDQESDRLKYRKLTEEDIPSWLEFFIGNDRLDYMGVLFKTEYLGMQVEVYGVKNK